jgi:diguanylate cyclase (GGDEF)-like protein
LPYIAGVLAGRRQVFERSAPLPDGSIRHSLITYAPDVVDGVVRGFFVHVADVTRMKALEIELQAAKTRAETLATHDFLTGLPNRMLLEDRISAAISSAGCGQHLVALISMDMDNFKYVNDTYGHAEGDRVLKEVAARVRSAIRESDSLTRMGGDEFILLSPAIKSRAHVQLLVDRILHAVQQPLHISGGSITPSLSIGAALYPADAASMEELMLKSDQAMYSVKKRARTASSI